MTLLMRDQENFDKGKIEGKIEGKVEGEEKMLTLIQLLVDNKRFGDIAKLKENKAFRQKLYREYNIPE